MGNLFLYGMGQQLILSALPIYFNVAGKLLELLLLLVDRVPRHRWQPRLRRIVDLLG
jgi:hypothetical protein